MVISHALFKSPFAFSLSNLKVLGVKLCLKSEEQ